MSSHTPRLPVLAKPNPTDAPQHPSKRRLKRTTWPSMASNNSNKNSNALVLSANNTPLSPKPPLLCEIESYIERELRMMQKQSVVMSPATTFQLYRECFSVFSTHFRDYAPFLQRVLQHFDAMILGYQQLQYQNSTMSNELSTVYAHQEAIMKSVTGKYDAEVEDLTSSLHAVQSEYATMKDAYERLQIDSERVRATLDRKDAEIDDLNARTVTVTNALREQSLRQGKLFQQLKKLRSDNQRLQTLLETMQKQVKASSKDDDDDAVDDLVGVDVQHMTQGLGSLLDNKGKAKSVLTRVARAVRPPQQPPQQLSASTLDLPSPTTPGGGGGKRVSTSESVVSSRRKSQVGYVANASSRNADNLDLFTFADVEELREVILDLQGRVRHLQHQNITLEADNRNLKDRVERITQNSKEQAMTPRARWKRVMELVPDVYLNLNQSSDDILSDVIEHLIDLSERLTKAEKHAHNSAIFTQWLEEEELTEYDLKGKAKKFIGMGTGPHVPVYLRYHGMIRNRRLKKGDVEGLLDEIWKERKIGLMGNVASDLTFMRLRRIPFEQYVMDWLERRTGSTVAAVELAYNIVDGCERYRYDPDCEIFLRILRNQISEEAYVDQLAWVETLRKLFAKLDNKESPTGVVPRMVAFRLMSRYFSTISDDDLLKLRYALMTDFPGDDVNYERLFAQTEDGDQTRFVVLMRNIHLQNCVEYTVDVEEAIRAVADAERNVSLRVVRDAVLGIDPQKSDADVTALLSLGAGCSAEQVTTLKGGMEAKFNVEEFVGRLRMGLLRRATKKTREPARFDDDEDYATIDAIISNGAGGNVGSAGTSLPDPFATDS